MKFRVKVAVVKKATGRGNAVRENRIEKDFDLHAVTRKEAIERGKQLMAEKFPDLTPHVLSTDVL